MGESRRDSAGSGTLAVLEPQSTAIAGRAKEEKEPQFEGIYRQHRKPIYQSGSLERLRKELPCAAPILPYSTSQSFSSTIVGNSRAWSLTGCCRCASPVAVSDSIRACPNRSTGLKHRVRCRGQAAAPHVQPVHEHDPSFHTSHPIPAAKPNLSG